MIKLNTYFSSVVTRQFVILPLIATKKGNQPSKTLSLLVVMFLLPLLSLAQKISCYYTGRTIDESGEGVPSTTVIMLNPQDSTVVTYGIADAEGHFSIPCNRPNLIAKFRSIGYKTKYLQADSFELGDIIMEPSSAKLQEVTVVANDVVNYPDKTVFIPNSRQKNASQSTIDLLSQMAIPMIYVNPVAQEITTASGKGISIYVNGLPLEKGESTGLNMKDVKRVEYLDYPSDPRFQGAAHVINFIMQQYEYGGYVKAFGKENFIANSGQLQANVRFQFKKMRYDAMFMGYYHNSPHNGLDEYETFRLLQDDGTLETFNRTSISDASKRENQQYFASLRAIYESNNTTASSMVSGSIDRLPKNNSFGLVTYSKDAFPSSEYAQIGSNNSKFIKYSGNYQFRSNNHGSLTFNPVYSYSHTSRLTNYMETGQPDFMNKALDNTHEVYGRLDYFKKFGQVHSLRYFIRGDYETSRTHYSGTASSFEKQNTSLFGTGATYTYYKNNLYLLGGFGWDWYWVGLNDIKERFSNPWADFSLQYSFLRKNTISLDFHYSVWPPSANYRSENIVKANHLFYYTGNPNLVSDKSFDFGVNYRFVPGKKIAITAFATAWIKKDRYVYDYESTPTHILRTIKQPLGGFGSYNFGISTSVYLLDRSLTLQGRLADTFCHNGAPYNWNKHKLAASMSAYYHLGDFTFSAYYSTPTGKCDGSMNGIWKESRSTYALSIGWNKAEWNVKASANNFGRWHWHSSSTTMHSQYYDNYQVAKDVNSHAFFSLSATYTFSFGKKINQSDELRQSGKASNGILSK